METKNLKYFAKWLPVEGEIREGDRYKISEGDEIFTCHHVEKGFVENNDTIWSGEVYRGSHQKFCKKVKLFLCSRDTADGDTIRFFDNPLVQISTDKEYKYDRLVERMVVKNPLLPKYMYRVVGEISSEATWVKEGDEFDEKDLLLFEYPEGLDQKDFWAEWDWKNLNKLLENVKLGSSVLIKVIK